MGPKPVGGVVQRPLGTGNVGVGNSDGKFNSNVDSSGKTDIGANCRSINNSHCSRDVIGGNGYGNSTSNGEA